ncbi:MFS transporter [Rhodococcus koreensis]
MLAPLNGADVDQEPGSPGAPRPGRWIAGLAALVLLTEQTALGFLLIAPTLTGFAAKFQTTQVIWMITIFTLVGGVATPLVGKLGDQFGKRRILLAAALVSMVGAVVCALAGSFGVILVGRALMGLSLAFLPVTFALIRDVFPFRYRAMSIALVSNGAGVVTIAGPFIAGFLIDHFSLSAVFWFVVVLTAVGSLGVIALIPETSLRSNSRIDYGGATGFTAGFLLLMFGISQLPTWQFANYRTALTIGGGIVILGGWWAWERRIREPFIAPELLSRRPVAPILFTFAFAGAAFTVVASYLPTMLQTPRALGGDYGFGASATGVAGFVLLGGLLTVAGGILVGTLGPRYGYRPFLIIAPVVTIVGALGIGFLRTEQWMPVVFYGLVGFGYISIAASAVLLMIVTPPHLRGVTGGMTSALGGAAGGLFAQIAGMVLASNVGQVVEGQPIFTGRGMELVFVIAALLSGAALVCARFTPGKGAQQEEPDPMSEAVPATVQR